MESGQIDLINEIASSTLILKWLSPMNLVATSRAQSCVAVGLCWPVKDRCRIESRDIFKFTKLASQQELIPEINKLQLELC